LTFLPKASRNSSRPAERRTRSLGSIADRKAPITNNDQLELAGLNSRVEDRCELLEVQGFDLMAQIEAMLRHAREYQRELQRLRGILGKGQTDTSEMNPVAAVRHHVEQMQLAFASFGETLADVRRIVDSLDGTDGSRKHPSERVGTPTSRAANGRR
jgi:hypothetical protein